jgi:hypothetical protein
MELYPFPRACGIQVITLMPYGALDQMELEKYRRRLAYQEKQAKEARAGVVFVTHNHMQIGAAQILKSRKGWKMVQEFRNPNSGSTCYVWMKNLTEVKK